MPNCGATYTTNITSTLQRHLDSHTNFELSQYSLRRQCFDLPVEDRISNWMIRSLLPFRCVDNQEFKDLFLEVVPSRKAIKHQIEQKFNLRKEKLKDFFSHFKGKVSFTMDLWTSLARDSFMGVTAHFIHNFKLLHLTIALRKVTSHVGSYLAEIFYKIIAEYNLLQNIGWITCDNASNNDTFFSKLQLLLLNKAEDPQITDRHARCICHVINLVVQELLSLHQNDTNETTMERRANRRLSSSKKHKKHDGTRTFQLYSI